MSRPLPSRPTVIVVDDDDGLRTALRYSLEIDGFNVVTCASGESLLRLSLPQTSACLIVDQVLPGLSGIDALEALRARQVDLPAIVITSAPDAQLRARTMLANACLIEKPLLNDRLTRAIRSLLFSSGGPACARAEA